MTMKIMRAMSFCRFAASAILALGAFLAPAVAAEEAAVPEGVVAFADALVNRQYFMLSDAERGILHDLQREMKAASEDGNNADLAAAAEKWTRHLAKSDLPVAVAVDGRNAVPHTSGPHVMPERYGSVILRIDAGPGETVFRVQEQAFDRTESRLEIPLPANGTSYVLLIMDKLPVEESVIPLKLQRPDQPNAVHNLVVQVPQTGRLALVVQSDDTGKPTPAMVRITNRRTGRDIQPVNFVDLSTVFDGHANPTGHRQPYLPPGRHGEDKWWIIPGPFNMELDPGEYDLTISRGMEHAPLSQSFEVQSGEKTALELRPKRWIDMRDHGWYSGDDHVHCQIMSDDDADKVMAWIQAEDVHVANIVKMGDIHRTWFEQRGFGEEYRVIDGDYVLSPGQEGPRTHHVGHTLSMNTDSMVRDTNNYFLYDLVADEVHAQGGLFGFAHVTGGEWNRGGAFNVQAGMTLWVPGEKTDFVEIIQFGGFGPGLYYEFLNLGFPLTASAGSDVPWGGTVGEARVYAYIGAKTFTPDAWFDAVDAGWTFVTSGPMVDFRVNGTLPGSVIDVERGEKVRVQATAWGHRDRAPLQRIELLRWGQIIETAVPTEANPYEITMDLEVDAGDGCWLAARVYAANGSGAQSTPVYVQREGLRWWDYANAEGLIAKRLASLDELEQMAKEAKAKLREGVPHDQHDKEMGEQADEFLERVTKAREFYQGLKQTAQEEAALRKD